jgi:amino acid transporter
MYNNIIKTAVAQGFVTNPPPEGPLMPHTLAWAAAITLPPYTAGMVYIAGEVKRADSAVKQHIAMEVATVVTVLILILGGVTWLYTAGFKFMSAFYYLGGSVQGLPLSFYFWTFFPAIMPTWAVYLFAIAVMLSCVAVAYTGIMVVSRCMFAWSFDRVIPSFFGSVSDRTKQPIGAVAAGLIFALILLFLEAYTNIFTYLAAEYFMILLNVFVVCIAGMIFPFLRKDMFEQMPIKRRIGGIPVLSIVSFIGAALFAWMGTSYFTNPDYFAAYGITQATIYVAVFVWVIAVVIFFISRAYNKRRGIDLGIAFKQIPPA